MKSFDLCSPELVYYQCKKIDVELTEIISSTLKICGNRYLDDVLQDTYIKAIELFLNSNIIISDFHKQLKDVCQDICFQYWRDEKKNVSKPIKGRERIHGGDGSADEERVFNGINFQWELTPDNTGNGLNIMIANETIASLKQYKKKWLTYNNAKDYISQFQIKSKKHWDEFCKTSQKISNIPNQPHEIYDSFISWDDFLGIRYYQFQDCLNWVRHNCDFNSIDDWGEILDELPREIPKDPDVFYKETGWVDWFHFMGISKDRDRYLPYKKAQEWVEENLWQFELTADKWALYLHHGVKDAPKLPSNIPSNPDVFYSVSGWVNWFKWFGTANRISKKYSYTYRQCLKWVRENIPCVNTKDQWDDFIAGNLPVKRPDYLPPNPDAAYANSGWHGWKAFLAYRQGDRFYVPQITDSTNMVQIMHEGKRIWVVIQKIHKKVFWGKVTSLLSSHKGSVLMFEEKDVVDVGDRSKRMKDNFYNQYKKSVCY